MPKHANIPELVTGLCEPIARELGVELWDVEFKKEGSDYFLRIYLDREGGIDIDTCEAFSRRISDVLDEVDPIEQGYYLEVSSAGLDRTLKRERDFERYLGAVVDVGLYRKWENSKQVQGELMAFDADSITIRLDEKPPREIRFERRDVAIVKLAVLF